MWSNNQDSEGVCNARKYQKAYAVVQSLGPAGVWHMRIADWYVYVNIDHLETRAVQNFSRITEAGFCFE